MYCLFLVCAAARAMTIQVDYTLEDAIRAGKDYMVKRFGVTFDEIIIEATTYIPINDLAEKIFEFEMKGVKEDTPKGARQTNEKFDANIMMGRIIRGSDLALYKKTKKFFKPNEQQYIEAKLNIKI